MILVDRGGSKTGMAQRLARGAHNSEVTGSKPVAGISPYRVHRSVWTFPRHKTSKTSKTKSTGMAQGQRAWLITTRTQDRDLLPVPVLIEFIALYGHFQDSGSKDIGGSETRTCVIDINKPLPRRAVLSFDVV
jgi:hypothetical protein